MIMNKRNNIDVNLHEITFDYSFFVFQSFTISYVCYQLELVLQHFIHKNNNHQVDWPNKEEWNLNV